MEYIAHPDKHGKNHQSLQQHLSEVGRIAAAFANKIDQPVVGELLGLLHDFGKYSQAFQKYILSAVGIINVDEDDYVDSKAQKGKIDHSTAGAQWLFQALKPIVKQYYPDHLTEESKLATAVMQIMALCIASHHSGLIDNLVTKNSQGFVTRLVKADDKTHFNECVKAADPEILKRINELVSGSFIPSQVKALKQIHQNQHQGFQIGEVEQAFYLGLYTKFMFSCLIDADRINSADFETPENKLHRHHKPDWQVASMRIESFLSQLPTRNAIDEIRQRISQECFFKAKFPQGIYSLTVPTGGGKTFASLRYAIQHAKEHKLDRIFYIIPYTSIIDQNAAAIRSVLEQDGDEFPWVLEQHSNLEPELQTWRSKLVSENWDAPIVLTTMVQFLETLLGGGTRGVRKLHQLANSVIIFDEIQTIPINCVHLFSNSLNFLAAHCRSTAVLCTATQPLLHKLKHSAQGQLHLLPENELISDVSALFIALKRVNVIDKTKKGGWTVEELGELALDELQIKQSCLIIVNTKGWAQNLFKQLAGSNKIDLSALFHLSTAQCPAHRKILLQTIRQRLDAKEPVICISTQLIEAGVDVDFASVIRFQAGLDSIAQAAGRCNRNGNRQVSQVYVVNPSAENIDLLEDIKVGRDTTSRLLNEFKNRDLLDPEIMHRYFQYYFFDRSDQMAYPLKAKQAERDDSLLNLLSLNSLHEKAAKSPFPLNHSFMTAGKVFKAIDAPTQAIIVPFQEGKALITTLCDMNKKFEAKSYYQVLKKCQQYSVNVFPNVWQALVEEDAIYEISEGEGVYYLDERFYSPEFGLTTKISVKQDDLVI